MRGESTLKAARAVKVRYFESMYVRLSRYAKLRFNQALEDVSTKDAESFMLAAEMCEEHGVDPREFVAAQFAVFDKLPMRGRSILLPMPHHLRGEKALVRWREWRENPAGKGVLSAAEAVMRARRSRSVEGQLFDPERFAHEFYRQERKLEALARVLRLPPSDVLRKHRGEFTDEFLSAMGAAA